LDFGYDFFKVVNKAIFGQVQQLQAMLSSSKCGQFGTNALGGNDLSKKPLHIPLRLLDGKRVRWQNHQTGYSGDVLATSARLNPTKFHKSAEYRNLQNTFLT
jgi:hypothetical protein